MNRNMNCLKVEAEEVFRLEFFFLYTNTNTNIENNCLTEIEF